MDIDSMTVADLKRELKTRNLAVRGAKAELAQRLKDALSNTDKQLGDDQLPEGELSDEGLLNEDDLLKDSTDSPVKQKDTHIVSTHPKEPRTEKAKIGSSAAGGAALPPQIVKTAAALQKEGVLESMEDDLFSDRPPQPAAQPVAAVSADKLKARAERFGLPEAKFEQRSKKFGLAGKIGEVPVEDKQKLMDRAKRFGLAVGNDGRANSNTSAAVTVETGASLPAADIEKLRKRAERFGGNVSTLATKLDDAERLAKRKAKFASVTAPSCADVKTPSTKDIDMPTAPKRKPIVF